MRIGTFMVPLSHQPEGDSAAIDSSLAEAVLAEEVGLDAVWLTEHHFVGESVYADPIVFASAIAARTTRVKIGLAVVEMALNHPVRVAVQTSLLDNLSHGRLIVGTGRGSAFNHYEYAGFGTTIAEGRERIEESEELLVKAWTANGLRHEGKHWKAVIPQMRPMPYQKPHPPLVRAVLSEDSVRAMAAQGRPILMGGLGGPEIMDRVNIYRSAMSDAGFSDEEVARAVDNIWTWMGAWVAPTHAEARERAEEGFRREQRHSTNARHTLNPLVGGDKGPDPADFEDRFDKAYMVGTPDHVAEQLIELQSSGVPNVMLKLNTGQMDPDVVAGMMRLFGEQVLPRVRQEGNRT